MLNICCSSPHIYSMDIAVERREQSHNERDSYVTASSIAELAKDRLGADQAARFVKRCWPCPTSRVCVAGVFTVLHLHCKRE